MSIDTENSNGFLLNGFYRPPASGSPPKQLVVIFHGLSADGAGMIAFGHSWEDALPDTSFLAPNAPFPFDMGTAGWQWLTDQHRTEEQTLQDLRAAAKIVNPFLDDALAKLRLDDSNLALVGFSQGGMVALHVGLRRPRPPAAVVCMSGVLLAPKYLKQELTARPPVLFTHGGADTAVPAEEMILSKERLWDAGVTVETLLQPDLDHQFDDVTRETVKQFLAKYLLHEDH